MTVATTPEQLSRDLRDALARLRLARAAGDEKDSAVFERRLNWLIGRVPRGEAGGA